MRKMGAYPLYLVMEGVAALIASVTTGKCNGRRDASPTGIRLILLRQRMIFYSNRQLPRTPTGWVSRTIIAGIPV